MCPPPEGASFWQRLKHDYQNSYNRIIIGYTAIVTTCIFLAVIFDLKVGN